MKDPFGLIPEDIKARHERAEWVDRAATAGRALERELKSLYGRQMEVVLVKPTIDPAQCPPSAIPGRWHVRRNNPPPAVPTYIPITTPDGGYRDPDSGVIAELANIDLRRPEVMQKFLDRSRIDSPHKKRERDLRTEQRRDVLKSDFLAAKRVRGEGGLKKSFAGKKSKAQKLAEAAKK
jgi:hypothetical protein